MPNPLASSTINPPSLGASVANNPYLMGGAAIGGALGYTRAGLAGAVVGGAVGGFVAYLLLMRGATG